MPEDALAKDTVEVIVVKGLPLRLNDVADVFLSGGDIRQDLKGAKQLADDKHVEFDLSPVLVKVEPQTAHLSEHIIDRYLRQSFKHGFFTLFFSFGLSQRRCTPRVIHLHIR